MKKPNHELVGFSSCNRQPDPNGQGHSVKRFYHSQWGRCSLVGSVYPGQGNGDRSPLVWIDLSQM